MAVPEQAPGPAGGAPTSIAPTSEQAATEKGNRHSQGRGMDFDLNCTPAEEEDILQDDMNMEEEEGIDPGQDAVGELQYSCHEQSIVHLYPYNGVASQC